MFTTYFGMVVNVLLLINEVLKKIGERLFDLPLGKPSFSDPRYISHDFNLSHFHSIGDSGRDSMMSFVDGGNGLVFGAPNFAIHLTRVCFNLFMGATRCMPKNLPSIIEFYTISCASYSGGRIFYETEFVPAREEWVKFLPGNKDLIFDSFDPALRTGSTRVPISRVAEVARLFAEWRYAGYIIEEELDSGDMLIRDGTLQTMTPNESKYADETERKALSKNAIIIGLSKTSSLLTTTGLSLFAAIGELAESSAVAGSSWFYHPIVDITHPEHRAEMYAVKLHPQSDYVFKLEIFKPQAKAMSFGEIEASIGDIAANSCDGAFPGYPYGLLDADRFARVSYEEKESRKIQFLACAYKDGLFERLKKCHKSSDAHDVINAMVKS